jgi:hypothetical protein
MLSACQPPTYQILAHQEGYRLIFTARGSGVAPFRNDDDIEATRLTVRDQGRYVWVIERDTAQPECRSQGRSPPFPVAYGSSVPCYRTLVEPQPIARDTLYRVQGEGLRHGSGYFRYEPFAGGGRATNLDWDDVESEVRAWRPVPDPRGADQVSNSTDAAPAAAEANAMSANKP